MHLQERSLLLAFLALLLLFRNVVDSLSVVTRRGTLQNIVGLPLLLPTVANAEGLGAKLAKKDPAALKNSVFNVPPSAQVYPDWMKGDWQVTSSFRGYVFPSQTIPKSTITKDVTIPGFQKCSIAATSDVGKENVGWKLKVGSDGREDRITTLASQIDGYLGYKAVSEVIYDQKSNPNRLSIDFVDYKTINAERIEMFCNARESESYIRDDGVPIFVCSEYIRQVTFGGGSEVGIPRQVGGNYANFWTWKFEQENKLSGNLLTAAYLDPQDALFFDEPAKPVAIYSHSLVAERKMV
mmetsp:Transcript_6328/g.9312  ORF Transcript_6328/g.9312 Transcript_6328/m.9312 type:complete len:296 (+) Transcript_6328:73-960(+)